MRYDFSDDWSAQFTWDNYNDNTQSGRPAEYQTTDTIAPTDNLMVGPSHEALTADRSRANDYKTSSSSGNFLSTIQGNNSTLWRSMVAIGNHDLKFITSMMDYQRAHGYLLVGLAHTRHHLPIWYGTPDNPPMHPVCSRCCVSRNFEQSSNEIQITSDFDGPINYVAGIYTMESEAPTSNQARCRSSSLCRT